MSRNLMKSLFGLTLGATLSLGIWHLSSSSNVAAQSPGSVGLDPTLMATYKWRSIGPDRGGRSLAVAGALQRPQRGLLRRDRRRAVEDHGRRRHVGAGHRRPDHELLGRRGRRVGNESRHRLHRHGRVVHPRQHSAGRRRVQIHRRRQDVEAHRIPRRAEHLEDPHPSDQSGHRVRRGFRPLRRAERRARHVQEHRWRRDVAQGPLPRRQDGRRRPLDRSQESERHLRLAVGSVPDGIHDVERRPGQRPVQVHRRRRALDRDHAQPGHARQV